MPLKTFPNVNRVVERTLLLTADGKGYDLDMPPERVVISEEGLGLPPIDYVSQRGPYQHGETVRDFFLKPRPFQYVIRHNYCDRASYWAGRQGLLDVVRPNRGGSPGQLTLRRIIPATNGKMLTRDLLCVVESGPAFAARKTGEWDELAYTEILKGIAYNPIWFDPAGHSVVYTPTVVATFPMTFPVTFISSTGVQAITYLGDWPEYPTITITGPANEIIITNTTTGQFIGLSAPILVGQTITISLGYGLKTVTRNDGVNLIGFVNPASNLAQFHLEPGANSITIQGVSGIGVATRVTFTWNDRYLGI